MPARSGSNEQLTGLPEPETDAGPPRAGKGSASASRRQEPERRCIATLGRQSPSGMVRFVLAPDGRVVPDVAARLPGRGAWVTASAEALGMAASRGAFSRAFKRQAVIPPDLRAQTEALLVRRCLDSLGMARRAGALVAGYEQVREAVRNERPGCLITASDASEDQRAKVLALVRGLYGPGADGIGAAAPADALPPVACCFDGTELGMALGRERVIHACLRPGPLATALMGELARLSGFRRVWLPGWLPVPGAREGTGL